MSGVLRWVLLLPSIAVAWYLGVISAISIYSVKEKFCPPEYITSSLCYAPWSRAVNNFVFMLGPAIAAFLIVLLPSLLAPRYKKAISTIIYSGGVIAAGYLAFRGNIGGIEIRGFISSAAAGALATFTVHRRLANPLTCHSSGWPSPHLVKPTVAVGHRLI